MLGMFEAAAYHGLEFMGDKSSRATKQCLWIMSYDVELQYIHTRPDENASVKIPLDQHNMRNVYDFVLLAIQTVIFVGGRPRARMSDE